MVSRIHVSDMDIGKCSLSVSRTSSGSYLKIREGMTIPHGKDLMIKVGSIPSRFLKLTFSRKIGGNIPRINVFGLRYEEIRDKIEIGAEQYLFDRFVTIEEPF